MAEIDDLIAQVEDGGLRARLADAAKDLRATKTFGLVFERHLPEAVPLPGADISSGDTVIDRRDESVQVVVSDSNVSTVSGVATNSPGKVVTIPRTDALKMQALGSQILPLLKRKDFASNGPGANHLVVKGENFFALQLLCLTFRYKIDCIYIDPPYNTGAKDWKYNNAFVDSNDLWRHSKWLSFYGETLDVGSRATSPRWGSHRSYR